jgi:aspartyl protease family protein
VNDGDQALHFIYLLGVLVLVGSALAVRRIPLGQTVKMLLAWVLIFAAGFVIFALRDDFRDLGRRVLAEGRGDPVTVSEGETLRIRQAPDGHYWVTGSINGESVRFLVDSGATVTSISAETARRAGIEARGGFPVMVQTANGTVAVQRGRAERLAVGSIERRDLPVHIHDGFGGTNVLGMNFLSSLSGWGVDQGWLVLRP